MLCSFNFKPLCVFFTMIPSSSDNSVGMTYILLWLRRYDAKGYEKRTRGKKILVRTGRRKIAWILTPLYVPRCKPEQNLIHVFLAPIYDVFLKNLFFISSMLLPPRGVCLWYVEDACSGQINRNGSDWTKLNWAATQEKRFRQRESSSLLFRLSTFFFIDRALRETE